MRLLKLEYNCLITNDENMKFASFNPNFFINYDIDRGFQNCECDCTCRYDRIHDVTINSVQISIEMVNVKEAYLTKANARRRRDVKPSNIERYCIDRLLRIFKAYDPHLYEASITRGYYREEIGNFTFKDADKLNAALTEMLNLSSDVEKVKYVLRAEYLMPPEALEPTSSVRVEKMELKKLQLNDVYLMRLKRENTEYAFSKDDVDLPVGVVLRSGEKIHLVDGYHRYSALLSRRVKSASYIVLE